jgi:hypothetical protein
MIRRKIRKITGFDEFPEKNVSPVAQNSSKDLTGLS